MSSFHVRLLRTVENTYLGAAGAFQTGRFLRSEIMAHGTMSMAAFLEMDPDAPEDIQVHGKIFYEQARDLSSKARHAWISRETEGRLSGKPRMMAMFDRELDAAGEEMKEAVRAAVRDTA